MKSNELMPLIIEAYPGFRKEWERVSAGVPAEPGPFPTDYQLAVGDGIDELLGHLGRLYRRGETACFAAIFTVLDRALAESDDGADYVPGGPSDDAGYYADELIEGLWNTRRTYCDPSVFEPYLGPVAAEEWRRRLAVEAHFPPDPRAGGVLRLLVEHNPARLTGNLRLEYRGLANQLPGYLDLADSFELMRRCVWQLTMYFIPPHLVGPEDRFDTVARILWEQWTTPVPPHAAQ